MAQSDTQALLHGILGVIAAASVLGGCSGRTIDDGSSSNGGDDETSTDMQTEGSSSTDATSESTDEGDTEFIDIGGSNDTGPDGDCGPFADAWELTLELPPECETYTDLLYSVERVCFWPPDGASCLDEPYTKDCILEHYACGFITVGHEIVCGPLISEEGACCYTVAGECVVGRPFSVGGRSRLASLEPGHDWSAGPRPHTEGLDADTRAALADAWTQSGRSEHASIASFARFTAQLQALAAPAELCRDSLRAGLDEREHALRCFGLARGYAAQPCRPGALDVRSCHEHDPVAIAVSLASEGCIAETVSLQLLIAAREHATDPAVRACLSQMVIDEQRHVLLAWRALAWMCARFGDPVRRAVAGVFARAERHVGFGARTQLPGHAEHMRAHGYLPIETRRELAIAAIVEIVEPAAAALLRGSSLRSTMLRPRTPGES